ncbi:MAG: hypothetical protein CMG34_04865 [Candidatus Marinimicrobia bacterium]|nr:hypothetical protein [Candidatus Neomarinimicrobiota bacterium]|tara:strand:- start:6767 stop:7111 length:345 start_codon:yes stop_codon:yes gene_type:complete
MSSKNKIKGTAFETAVVNYINNNSCLNVERRALSGMNDKGDIIGVPDTAIECKNVKDWSQRLGSFINEAEEEAANASVNIGVVVIKKRNAPIDDAYVVQSLRQWVETIERDLNG